MATPNTLLIEKDGTNKFRHTHNGLQLSKFAISDFECSIDDNWFKVVEKDGASRFKYLISNITIKDNTDSGTPENYSNPIVFEDRLRELGYTPYLLFNTSGLTPDQQDAIDGANAPSASNPIATMNDIVTGIQNREVKNLDDSLGEIYYTFELEDQAKIINLVEVNGDFYLLTLPDDVFPIGAELIVFPNTLNPDPFDFQSSTINNGYGFEISGKQNTVIRLVQKAQNDWIVTEEYQLSQIQTRDQKVNSMASPNAFDFPTTTAVAVYAEPKLPAGGNSTHYLRGDKTWQVLSAAVLGVGSKLKDPMQVATTYNIVLSGPTVIAGGSFFDGYRILALAQTNPVENGPWIYNTAGAWTRPTDFANGSQQDFALIPLTGLLCSGPSIGQYVYDYAYYYVDNNNGLVGSVNINIFRYGSFAQDTTPTNASLNGITSNAVYQGLLLKESLANKGANNGYAPLDSGGKIPLANLPSTLLKYDSVWDVSTNTPTLVNPDTSKIGTVYTVTGGPFTRFGIDWKNGDWLIYNASGVPEKSDNSDDVVSVNGQTGIVSLNTSHISESGNLYFTTARVLATVLTGLSLASGGAITSADTILQMAGKLQYQITNLLTDTVFGNFVAGLTAKPTPIGADSISISDSADSNKQKKVSLTQFITFLKGFFQDKSRHIFSGPVSVTSSTTIVQILSLKIPANVYSAIDGFDIVVNCKKSATAAPIVYSIYHDTTNTGNTFAITTATALAATNISGSIWRVMTIFGGKLINSNQANSASLSPFAPSGGIPPENTFDYTVDNYINFFVNPTVGSEVIEIKSAYIRPNK